MRTLPILSRSLSRLLLLEAVLVAAVTHGDDCNHNGVDDTDDIASDLSEDCNDNAVPDECELVPPEFGPSQPAFLVGETPVAIVAADLDGDGDLDLITGNRDSDRLRTSTVSVLVNDGGREFREVGEFPAGNDLWSLSAADIDGDGDTDVVLGSDSSITLLMGRGDATFATPKEISVQRAVNFVKVADVDGDGRPDLVAASADTGSIAVFPGRGDGVFGQPTHLTSGRTSGIDVADVDGDGDADLIIADRGSRFVAVVLQVDGAFSDRLYLDTVDARPHTVRAVDLDGDGLPDIAAVGNTTISVFLGLGSGEFRLATVLRYTGSPNSVTAADLDVDGDTDLAVGFLGDATASVILNTDSGFVPVRSSLPRAKALVARDLDGDGYSDLAAVGDSDSVSILWNLNGDDEHTLALDLPDNYPVEGRPHALALGDLEGDGDLDLVTTNNHGGGLSIARNNGDGSFGSPVLVLPDLIAFSVIAVDLDRDGHPDLVTIDQDAATLAVLENDNTGVFPAPQEYEVGANPFHVTAADLDRDGRPDIVTANQGAGTVSVLYNDTTEGQGISFASAVDTRTGGGCLAVASADLDGDGWPDLAAAHRTPPGITVLAGSDGRTVSKRLELTTIGTPNFVVAVDLDRDGDVDLVTAERDRQALSVYFNRGDGTFEPPDTVLARRRPYSLTTADLNADGYPDIIAANEEDADFSVFLGTGGGSFFFPYDYPAGGGVPSVLAGDLDGDGDLDLVSANRYDSDVSVFLNRSTPFTQDYLREICTELDFVSVSVASRGGGPVERIGKYLTPAGDAPSLLPTLFQNVVRFPLHEDFLRDVFFPSLSPEDYDNLVGRRRTREYFAGSLSRLRVNGERLYTFSVIADTGLDSGETPRLEEVQQVYEALRRSFRLEPLAYGPDTELARREAATWSMEFPVFLGGESPHTHYEPYTLGTAHGRVRLLTLSEFEDMNRVGRFTYQDILVVDQAPRDIEGVVGGIITAEPQADLSHLGVRTARRGTPNAYVMDAREAFTPFEGKLVRLDVSETGYLIEASSLEEAEQFWSTHRPHLARLPEVDAEYRELDALLEMDLSAAGGVPPEARYGGKATNMARMQRVLTGEFQRYGEVGFGIPVHYYREFLRTNSVWVGGERLTYEQYLETLLASPEFQSDSVVRFDALERFRDLLRSEGVVDPDLVSRIASRIDDVFGGATVMVRFRSSSNLEDSLEFNGAGLYESTSVCAADTMDPVTRRSSYCDPTRTNERTIERALKKVWASLWTFRAHEERSFFQIPPDRAVMGILVTRAFLDEEVNGVAFTGNPLNAGDRRYVVAAQVGEESVVTPEPGTSVERNLLEVSGGSVVSIVRDRSSSLVPPGEHVLSDDQLRELAAFMSHVERTLPVELDGHRRDDVLLDFEFKIEPGGSLAVKQVRPFLVSPSPRETPVFEAMIPPETTVCGVFSPERTGRGPREEYEAKSTVRFRPGTYALASARDAYTIDLIEEVVFGARQQRAEPTAPGELQLVRVADGQSGTIYRFTYEQEFLLPDGDDFTIRFSGLNFRALDGVPTLATLTFDDDFLASRLAMEGALNGETVVAYSSCDPSALPEWLVEVETADGTSVRLTERFLPSENDLGTGPASVVRAEVSLGGVTRVVSDYWSLVYSARRHNRDVRYWVVLDPPVHVPSLEAPVRAVEIEVGRLPEERFVRYLDSDFEVLFAPAVVAFQKEVAPLPRFTRGDANADGRLNLVDSLVITDYLFGGHSTPTCLKSADANDTGTVDIADVVVIQVYLFGGGLQPAPPFGACGVDETEDELTCESFPACQ